MRRTLIILVTLLLGSVGLQANQPDDRIAPSDPQKANMRIIERDLVHYWRSIEAQHRYIVALNLIRAGTNMARIPMRSELQSHAPVPQSNVYSSEGRLYFKENGKLDYIFIAERNSVYGTFNQTNKLWFQRLYGRAEDDGHSTLDGVGLNLLTYQQLESGSVEHVNFRMYTGFDLRESDQDPQLPRDDDYDAPTIYVTEPSRRVAMAMNYLELLKLLDRRIYYFTRRERGGAERELDYLLD